jgi:ankyrin repeat protein
MTSKRPKRKDRPGVDRAGRTELHYAAADGSTERVRELLAAGAAAGAPDDDGWTPLHFAAQAQAAGVVRLLLDAGADPDPVDASGNTPLGTATFNSRGRGDIIALLRRAGADPYRANAYGVSPVGLARTIANYDVRQYYADLPEAAEPEV